MPVHEFVHARDLFLFLVIATFGPSMAIEQESPPPRPQELTMVWLAQPGPGGGGQPSL